MGSPTINSEFKAYGLGAYLKTTRSNSLDGIWRFPITRGTKYVGVGVYIGAMCPEGPL